MNPHMIGPVIGGIIFLFVQLVANVGDESGLIRLTTLAIATAVGAFIGGVIQTTLPSIFK